MVSYDKKALYRKKYRNKFTDAEWAEKNRINSKRYREQNREKWNEYLRNYHRQWLADPVRKKAHATRTAMVQRVNGWFEGKTNFKPKKYRQEIYDICQFIANGNYDSNKNHVDHIVSLPHLFEFNINLQWHVVCDPINLQILSIDDNHRKYNKINTQTLITAHKLEEKFSELKGLGAFLVQKIKQKDK